MSFLFKGKTKFISLLSIYCSSLIIAFLLYLLSNYYKSFPQIQDNKKRITFMGNILILYQVFVISIITEGVTFILPIKKPLVSQQLID